MTELLITIYAILTLATWITAWALEQVDDDGRTRWFAIWWAGIFWPLYWGFALRYAILYGRTR